MDGHSYRRERGLNELAARVRMLLPEDTLLIIVNDHGMESRGFIAIEPSTPSTSI